MDKTVDSKELLGERMMVGVASDARGGTSTAHCLRKILCGRDCCLLMHLDWTPLGSRLEGGDLTPLNDPDPKLDCLAMEEEEGRCLYFLVVEGDEVCVFPSEKLVVAVVAEAFAAIFVTDPIGILESESVPPLKL